MSVPEMGALIERNTIHYKGNKELSSITGRRHIQTRIATNTCGTIHDVNRRDLFLSLIGLASLSTLYAQNEGRGRGRGRGRGNDEKSSTAVPAVRDSVYFRSQDYAVLQRYYSGPRDLPPGLRKKYARTGTLPPGWETKIRPFPTELVRVLPPPPPNAAFGYIDGVAVVYDRKTRIILDSIDLIAAIAGH
jgi:hypothetical protein